MTDDEIYRMVADGLHETFGLDRQLITLDATLASDLDIDSIDAVDLAARLQQATGKRIAPETFKSIRTVRDTVTIGVPDASVRLRAPQSAVVTVTIAPVKQP